MTFLGAEVKTNTSDAERCSLQHEALHTTTSHQFATTLRLFKGEKHPPTKQTLTMVSRSFICRTNVEQPGPWKS